MSDKELAHVMRLRRFIVPYHSHSKCTLLLTTTTLLIEDYKAPQGHVRLWRGI
jgi:hypothetical protein